MEDKGAQSLEMSVMNVSPNAVMLGDGLAVMDNLHQAEGKEEQRMSAGVDHRFPLKISSACIIVIVDGVARLSVNFRDLEATANTCIIISSGAIVERVETEPGTRYICLSLSLSHFPAASIVHQHDFYRLYSLHVALLQLQPVHVEMFKNGYYILRTVLSDPAFQVNRSECALSCVGLLGGLLAQGVSNQPEVATKASRKDEIVARFLRCVHENYRSHRDLGFYADQLCLSIKYMSHVVYEQTGRHPSRWIKDYVILDAKTMLRNGRYTVQQVAEELNFPNQSFFGKYFKEAVGVSPKKWK